MQEASHCLVSWSVPSQYHPIEKEVCADLLSCSGAFRLAKLFVVDLDSSPLTTWRDRNPRPQSEQRVT